MKILINHSNHPSEKWNVRQKKGWDKIIDLLFPNIDPGIDTDEVGKIALENFKKIREIAVQETTKNKDATIYVMLQGGVFLLLYSFSLFEKSFSYCNSHN